MFWNWFILMFELFFLRNIHALCWILCSYSTVRSEDSARNKRKNSGANPGLHQLIEWNKPKRNQIINLIYQKLWCDYFCLKYLVFLSLFKFSTHVPITAKGGRIRIQKLGWYFDEISFDMEKTSKMHHTIVPVAAGSCSNQYRWI